LIDEMGENELLSLTFSGGDALEWPHILPAVERTLEAGITPVLSTKACLFEKRCAKLAAIGVRQMQYSLDAATAGTAEMMTGRRNFLTQAVSSIRNLIRAGIEVRLKSVITPYNVSEVPGLFALASDLGVRIVHLAAYGRSTFRHSDALFLAEEAGVQLREQVRSLKEHYPNLEITGFGFNDGRRLASAQPRGVGPNAEQNAPSKHGVPLATSGGAGSTAGAGGSTAAGDAWAAWKHPKSICSMGRTALAILPDGSVLMCEQLPSEPRFIVGSVAHRSIRELWASSEFSNRTLRPDRELFRGRPCYDCPEFVWCHEVRGRCIRDAYKAYGDPYQSDPRCPRALPGARLG
jgi:radical SAM protein with 4Fe4S-binding SPASM domain